MSDSKQKGSFDSLARRRSRSLRNTRRQKVTRAADKRELLDDMEDSDGIGNYSWYALSNRVAKML